MAENTKPHPDQNYIDAVKASVTIDPMPTIRKLAENTGLKSEEIMHYILVQWATSGSEALMSTTPLALRQLKEAADASDTEQVKGIVRWMLAGL
jgi:hypothetical protein